MDKTPIVESRKLQPAKLYGVRDVALLAVKRIETLADTSNDHLDVALCDCSPRVEWMAQQAPRLPSKRDRRWVVTPLASGTKYHMNRRGGERNR